MIILNKESLHSVFHRPLWKLRAREEHRGSTHRRSYFPVAYSISEHQFKEMAERQSGDQHDTQLHSSPSEAINKDDMIGYVMALEAALLPCLPARELQAIDRSPHPSHQIDVERHARDFMEAAKKLQLYFISLQREEQATKEEILQKDIVIMEEELRTKTDLIKKQERLIQGWKKELKDQLEKHNSELERV